MSFRISLLGFLTLTLAMTRTETGAFAIIHIWIGKLGLHFALSARD